MTAKQLIMCCSRPWSFTMEQIRHFLRHNITVPFNGWDDPGLSTFRFDFLQYLRDHCAHLWHIAPVRIDTALGPGNSEDWYAIRDRWNTKGPENPWVYWRDEIFNRDLWGCPYNPQTERKQWINWKIRQIDKCQQSLGAFDDYWPEAHPFITADRPVPPGGGKPVHHDKLIRAYPLNHVEMAAEMFGDGGWRARFGMQNAIVGAYMPKPIFGKYSPTEIGQLVWIFGLDFFLYYHAEDEDLWFNNRATPEMMKLHAAMQVAP